MSPGIAVAVVPEKYYRKPNGVQFKRSFVSRENAVRYAEQHRCRVVIACEADERYDVLYEPESNPGPKMSFELVVDRGEMVAVPTLPYQEEAPEAPAVSDLHSSRTSPRTVWKFVQAWLRV